MEIVPSIQIFSLNFDVFKANLISTSKKNPPGKAGNPKMCGGNAIRSGKESEINEINDQILCDVNSSPNRVALY
jgi:hypothetical protein